ncbi:toprim domain-containing protein [Acidithiobacillus sp. MC6.1]|nr:toprim domain-containing protein [Acidithiobacillus sp. MC6.1]
MTIILMNIDHVGLDRSDFDEMRRNRVGRILVAYGYRPKGRGRWAHPGKDENSSLHVFPHGTWLDHRNTEENNCSPKALIQWLESQGFHGDPDQLTDTEIRIAQNSDNFAATVSSGDDKSLWAIHRWQSAKPVEEIQEDSIQAEIHNHNVESVKQMFYGRGLSTAWWTPDTIRVYGLQTAVGMEKTLREQGADLAFSVPMKKLDTETKSIKICGIQRTAIPHQDELPEAEYNPKAWRKIGRVMLGHAGFSHMKIPQDPDPSGYGGTLLGESQKEFLISIGYTGQQNIIVISEGLESGLSVAQQLPNASVDVTHSAGHMRSMAKQLLDNGQSIPSKGFSNPAIVLVAVDHDPGMIGQKAAAFLTRTIQRLGNSVFYLDPALPGEEKVDWNDSLVNGRMADDLLRAVQTAEKNLQAVPLGQTELAKASQANTVISLDSVENDEVVQSDCPRPVYSDIGITREELKNAIDRTVDHTMGLFMGEITTGVGKTTELAKLHIRTSAADKTIISTPQKRDASRIAEGDGYKRKYQRHGRQNRIDEISNGELLAAFCGWTQRDEDLVWTDDCTLKTKEYSVYSAESLEDLIREASIDVSDSPFADDAPGMCMCYRTKHAEEDPQLGTHSHKNGDFYPDALASQGHAVAPHCTQECPHGIHAVALLAKSREKQEELLDQEAMHIGPYQTCHRKNIQNAKIRQFFPCMAIYNRLESQRKQVVVCTNGTLERDKAFAGGAKHIHYDENPDVFESREFDWRMREQALRGCNKKMKSIKNHMEHLPQADKDRAKLGKILSNLSVVRDGIAFFKDQLDEAKNEITNVTIEQFFANNVENVAKFIRAVKWLKKEKSLPDKPYRAKKESHQVTIPKVFLEYFAEALELKTLYVVGGKIMFYTQTDATWKMLDIRERLKPEKPRIKKLTISIWSATPDISIDMITPNGNKKKFHVDEGVKRMVILEQHTKAAYHHDPEKELKKAQDHFLHFNRTFGLKAAYLFFKEFAEEMIEWAKSVCPQYQDRIGWVGAHDIAHNIWTGYDWLVQWHLDEPGLDVLAAEYEARCKIFGHQWMPIDFNNDLNKTVHIQSEILADKVARTLVQDNPDFERFLRWRISQKMAQANGRLRGVNVSMPQNYMAYTTRLPIQHLFGVTYHEVREAGTGPDTHAISIDRAIRAVMRVIETHQDPVMQGLPGSQADLPHIPAATLLPLDISYRTLRQDCQKQGFSLSHKNYREVMDHLPSVLPQVQSVESGRGRKTVLRLRHQVSETTDTDDYKMDLLDIFGTEINDRQNAEDAEKPSIPTGQESVTDGNDSEKTTVARPPIVIGESCNITSSPAGSSLAGGSPDGCSPAAAAVSTAFASPASPASPDSPAGMLPAGITPRKKGVAVGVHAAIRATQEELQDQYRRHLVTEGKAIMAGLEPVFRLSFSEDGTILHVETIPPQPLPGDIYADRLFPPFGWDAFLPDIQAEWQSRIREGMTKSALELMYQDIVERTGMEERIRWCQAVDTGEISDNDALHTLRDLVEQVRRLLDAKRFPTPSAALHWIDENALDNQMDNQSVDEMNSTTLRQAVLDDWRSFPLPKLDLRYALMDAPASWPEQQQALRRSQRKSKPLTRTLQAAALQAADLQAADLQAADLRKKHA